MTYSVLTILMSVLLQPPAPPAKPAKPETVTELKSESALRVNITVEQSVANHPDVRVAEARLMEAQAALAQARLKVAIEMTNNQAKLDQAKVNVATQTEFFQKAEQLKKSGVQTQDEYLKATTAFTAARAELAVQERLMKAVALANQSPEHANLARFHTVREVEVFFDYDVVAKPHSQSLRDLLQRKVKFAVKATDADRTVIGVLERSMKEWNFAQSQQIVRYPQAGSNVLKSPPLLQAVEGENTISGWLLLMLDEFNSQQEALPQATRGEHQIYVREYGLLFTLVKNAPDRAPTLAEFLQQSKK